MSSAKSVNIARLMSYNFDIIDLPDTLKCVKCKLVLKDACQMPCGCRFCRVCIDDMMASGDQFCPGVSEECGISPLSLFSLDYIANKSVSRLTAKCAHNGCVYECQLADMEEHLRECHRNKVGCPFRELGCKQDKFAAEEIGEHLQHENHRHNELLIGMIANINREIEMMKKDIETMKRELVLKDRQISTILDRMNHVENENKSIAREKADLADRVRLLTEQIERGIDERRENGELGMTRVIEYVDREIAAVKVVIGSNKDELVKQIKYVSNENQSINRGVKLIKDDICPIKVQLQSNQVYKLPDAKYDWLIYDYVQVSILGGLRKESDYFTGVVHAHKYQLVAFDCQEQLTLLSTNFTPSLKFRLRIYRDKRVLSQLVWPFEGRVVIIVADRDCRNPCQSISQHCRIERPSANNEYRESDEFVFLHSELRTAGLKLDRGLRVSCEIYPGPGS